MFKRILIANRGEIALRIIRCCREMDETIIGRVQRKIKIAADYKRTGGFCIGPAKAAESYL